MPGHVLIIDDEEQLRKLLTRIISLEGFQVSEAPSLKAATAIIEHQSVDVILCDVKLPDGNGVQFISTARKKSPSSEIILLTAFGNIPDGVQAIKNGAFDYIVKGNDNDRIIPLLHQAIDRVQHNKKTAIRVSEQASNDFNAILGTSLVIRNAIQLAKKIADTDSTVLLLGETGTGKEVFANAIHLNSRRSKHPIIAINCSAFSKELLESELFGHKAGAFTGATKDKKGLIEMAEGGTLFLDEIGELHIDLQAKLLRFLENGQFIKLGDPKISSSKVRIIAATNRPLKKQVEEGNFRQDLYYRLNVFSIELPPLRNRKEDILPLANYFVSHFSGKKETPVTISAAATTLLENYSWKGNIRELRNVIERALILVEGPAILPEHLPFEIQQPNPDESSTLSLASVEKQHIRKILEYSSGNKTRAAEILGIGLTTLYRKLEEYQLPK